MVHRSVHSLTNKYCCEKDQVQRLEWKWKSAIVKQTQRPSDGLGNIWSKPLWKNYKKAPRWQNIKKWRLAQDFCISEARDSIFCVIVVSMFSVKPESYCLAVIDGSLISLNLCSYLEGEGELQIGLRQSCWGQQDLIGAQDPLGALKTRHRLMTTEETVKVKKASTKKRERFLLACPS